MNSNNRWGFFNPSSLYNKKAVSKNLREGIPSPLQDFCGINHKTNSLFIQTKSTPAQLVSCSSKSHQKHRQAEWKKYENEPLGRCLVSGKNIPYTDLAPQLVNSEWNDTKKHHTVDAKYTLNMNSQPTIKAIWAPCALETKGESQKAQRGP